MFDVGFSEILVIAGLSLVVLGPDKLPSVARKLGHWAGRARAMARQFRDQLEAEADQLKTGIDPNLGMGPTGAPHGPAAATPPPPPEFTGAPVTPASPAAEAAPAAAQPDPTAHADLAHADLAHADLAHAGAAHRDPTAADPAAAGDPPPPHG